MASGRSRAPCPLCGRSLCAAAADPRSVGPWDRPHQADRGSPSGLGRARGGAGRSGLPREVREQEPRRRATHRGTPPLRGRPGVPTKACAALGTRRGGAAGGGKRADGRAALTDLAFLEEPWLAWPAVVLGCLVG